MPDHPPHDIAWGWLLFGLVLLAVTWPWRVLRRPAGPVESTEIVER